MSQYSILSLHFIIGCLNIKDVNILFSVNIFILLSTTVFVLFVTSTCSGCSHIISIIYTYSIMRISLFIKLGNIYIICIYDIICTISIIYCGQFVDIAHIRSLNMSISYFCILSNVQFYTSTKIFLKLLHIFLILFLQNHNFHQENFQVFHVANFYLYYLPPHDNLYFPFPR